MNTIECYKGLPNEYESFLIERYNSFMTTCRYIDIYFPDYDINYMLVYKDGVLIELLIFGNDGDTSTCFNSLVDIEQDIITEFTKNIFEIYPFIRKIKIAASYKDYVLNKAILLSKSNDHILKLPSTLNDYYLELGSTTRKHIKNYKARLLRDYPKANFITKSGEEIDEAIIDKIIQLNSERMKHKGIIPGKDKEKNNIYKYSIHYGCVLYIEIDGVVVAGCISTILNKRIFLQVIAHDNNFSRYDVGQICILFLIQTSIEKGLSTLHFLWGENDYKIRLLAKPQLLFSYFIYRAYSFDYMYSSVRNRLYRNVISFRLSKYSKPIRNSVKFFRKRNWNAWNA